MSTTPNVLFLFTDQQSMRAMGAGGGNPHLHTPHMDALAADGVRFERSYCTAPVCTPARGSLITSCMPHELGIDFNDTTPDPSIPNMGEVFRRAGYETAWAGKWHLPESYPQYSGGSIPGFELLPMAPSVRAGLGARTDAPAADAAIEFLRRPHDRPFLLAVSLHNPHDICYWIWQNPFASHPDPDALPPLPANFQINADEPEFITWCRRRGHYGPEGIATHDWTDLQWRAYLHHYYRLTEQVDAQFGRVLDALRQRRLADQTLIVFTSDHGEGMAAHRWVVKLMFWETVATVPLIVSGKAVPASGVVDTEHLVSGLDVLPTLCDYAGIEPPAGALGMSLRPLIEDAAVPGREYLVSELQPDPRRVYLKGRMVRGRRFKYVAFSHGRRPEMLFDMQADPGETRNLAGDPELAEELSRHRGMLTEWTARTHDTFVAPGT
jgi:arylsulfatase A-like enzyme